MMTETQKAQVEEKFAADHEQTTLRKPLDAEQRSLLERQLQNLTVVRMARKDIYKGNYDTALSRLRIDADKLRNEKELYAIIRYYFD